MQIIMTADAVLQITPLVLPAYTSVTMCRYRGAAAVVEGAAEVIGEAEIAIVEDHHRRRCQCKHQQISNDVDGINVCYYI